MLRENEIAVLMNNPEIVERTMNLKNEFSASNQELQLTDDDFISLILLAPTVGVALANGSISLFEELTLNKKARTLSRGSYFLKKDPVIYALKHLINDFATWELRFYDLLKSILNSTLAKSNAVSSLLRSEESSTKDIAVDLMNAPYIFIKFLSFMFLEDESDLLNQRNISKVEYNKIIDIAKHLELDEVPVFKSFCETFIVR